jgi:hypothetical protein
MKVTKAPLVLNENSAKTSMSFGVHWSGMKIDRAQTDLIHLELA